MFSDVSKQIQHQVSPTVMNSADANLLSFSGSESESESELLSLESVHTNDRSNLNNVRQHNVDKDNTGSSVYKQRNNCSHYEQQRQNRVQQIPRQRTRKA